MSFSDAFADPIRDEYADTGWAVSREDYSKEDAAKLFEQAAMEEDNETTWAEFLETMKEGFAVFQLGQNDDGKMVNAWWWQHGEVTKKGQKKVWLAY